SWVSCRRRSWVSTRAPSTPSKGCRNLSTTTCARFGIRVVLIEPPYTRTNLDASAAQAEGRIEDYAPQRRRTAAVITHNTNMAPAPKAVAEEVLRPIEG